MSETAKYEAGTVTVAAGPLTGENEHRRLVRLELYNPDRYTEAMNLTPEEAMELGERLIWWGRQFR